jgi:hypothetical protein
MRPLFSRLETLPWSHPVSKWRTCDEAKAQGAGGIPTSARHRWHHPVRNGREESPTQVAHAEHKRDSTRSSSKRPAGIASRVIRGTGSNSTADGHRSLTSHAKEGTRAPRRAGA